MSVRCAAAVRGHANVRAYGVEIHTHTHTQCNPRPRADLFYSVRHAVPRTPRDLQTAAVRPSINLFNPIIRMLCVRHRSRVADGDREAR